ncbi:MAG: hypothetical protein OXG51_06120 [Gammaproteobacteria bacterium]|nr:hypothetical protein [Gammaproteobacteria bacterium]
MPDLHWEEAQNYNQALLMAAQVRADYVALLFEVWNATFGTSVPQRIMDECFSFDHEDQPPSQIWESGFLYRSYYPDGDPEEQGRHHDLCVCLRDANLELRCYQYDEDYTLIEPRTPEVEGWSTTEPDDDEEGSCLTNEGVNLTDFLSDSDPVIERFAKDTDKIIEALLEN